MRFTRTIAGLSAACLMLSGSGAAFAPLPVSAYTAPAAAATGVVNGLKYSTEYGYGMITGYTDDMPADVTIPDTVGGKAVTHIDDNAFKNCTALHSVTIPDSVEWLGFECFRGCTNLEEIRFPEKFSTFGQDALAETKWFADQHAKDPLVIAANVVVDGKDCTGAVTVPEGVTFIGHQAFHGNKNLTSITLPDTLEKIGSWAFEDCTGLKELTLPGSLKDYGWQCFEYCTGLETLTLQEGIETTGSDTFSYCKSLKTISFPQSLRNIEDSFDGCSSLKEVTIPENVKYVYSEAFTDCTDLETVTVLGYYVSFSDFFWQSAVFSNSGSSASRATYTGKIRGYNGSDAQQYAEHFNVEFESLGDAPKSGSCGDQLTWTLQDDTLTIEGTGTTDSYGLGTVSVDNVTKVVLYDAPPWYMYRDQIKHIVIGADVKAVGDLDFANCTGLETVTMLNPEHEQLYGEIETNTGLHGGAERLFDGVIRGYAGSPAQEYAEHHSLRFEPIGEIPAVTTTAAAAAATTAPGGHCDTTTTAAKTTVIPGVTTTAAAKTTDIVGVTTTAKSTDVTELVPETTTAVMTTTHSPDDTFRGKCGESATWAYNFVLQNLEIDGSGDMTDYDINKQETAPWYPYAAEGDPYLSREISKIWIGDGITGIGAGAFFGCASVENVVLPENVGRIGENAFYLCGALKRIVIMNPECKIADTEWTISSGIRNNHAFFNGTIAGFEGSTAQAYAQKYGYRFEALTVDPESTAPVNGMQFALKLVPYLKTDGYTAAEQAEYQKQADEIMKKVAQITVTGDLIHVNEADPGKTEPYYNITDTLTDDAAEIAALSQYDSAPLTCRVQTYWERYDVNGTAAAVYEFLDASGNVLLNVDANSVAWIVRDGVTTYYDKFMCVLDLSKALASSPADRALAIRVLKSKTVSEQYVLADYDCETLLGDTDGDSDVSVIDAQLALKAYTEGVSGKPNGLTQAQVQSTDIDRDGKVSVEDVQLILKYYTENTVAGKTVTWAALRNA